MKLSGIIRKCNLYDSVKRSHSEKEVTEKEVKEYLKIKKGLIRMGIKVLNNDLLIIFIEWDHLKCQNLLILELKKLQSKIDTQYLIFCSLSKIKTISLLCNL